MKRLVLILLSAFCFARVSFSQYRGLPLVENINAAEYGAGMQNWWIGQDSLGIIYTANNRGILRFDGTDWELIEVEQGKKIRSLDVSEDGRVYTGGENVFGYLTADSRGEPEYISLLDRLDSAHFDFEDIWRIHCIENRVFFQSFEEVFLYENDTVVAVRDNANLSYSFSVSGEYILADYDHGLLRYDSGVWREVPGGAYFKKHEVGSVVSYNQNWLVGDVNRGLFTVHRDGLVEEWETNIDLIGEHSTDQLLVLNNGHLAVATRNGGLAILDQNGELVHFFSKGRGLNSRAILNIYEDREGNLWLGLNNGISRIELSGPFTYLDEQTGVQGAGYNATKSDNRLYLSARNGAFMVLSSETQVITRAEQIDVMKGQTYAVSPVAGDLLLAAHSGAYRIGKRQEMISDIDGWWCFVEIPNTQNHLIGGTYNGLYLLKKHGNRYQGIQKIGGFGESSRLIVFESAHVIWVSHGYKGAYRMVLSEDYTTIIEKEHFGGHNGFPSDVFINVHKINNDILFTAEKGVFTYDIDKGEIIPFEPFQRFFARERIISMDTDHLGNLYFIGSDFSGVLKRRFDGTYDLDHSIFRKVHSILNDDFPNVNVIDERNIIFGAKDGFVHFDPSIKSFDLHNSIEVYINRLINISHGDSLISGYATFVNEPSEKFTFPFSENSIRIEYTAPYYSSDVRYSYQLNGMNGGWSEWTNEVSKEYTNLREGSYTFMVKARDIMGHESPVKRLYIVITPPWYRTGWFGVLVTMVVVLLLVMSFRFQQIRHKREKKHIIVTKDRELNSRENELKEISRKSREQIDRLTQEKMEAELSHKSRELATSTMSIIEKNELITKIKSELKSIKDKVADKDSTLEINRIIKNIDRKINVDKDWDKFQIYFDEVHSDFSMRFKATFRNITPQDLKLCAYLRLNMNSKDIANLMNISVRSVETNRYRLRKKLNLPHDTNLTDFILDF